MPAILTGALFLMVVGLIATLMYQPTPESNSEVIHLVTGQIIGAFATAIATGWARVAAAPRSSANWSVCDEHARTAAVLPPVRAQAEPVSSTRVGAIAAPR